MCKTVGIYTQLRSSLQNATIPSLLAVHSLTPVPSCLASKPYLHVLLHELHEGVVQMLLVHVGGADGDGDGLGHAHAPLAGRSLERLRPLRAVVVVHVQQAHVLPAHCLHHLHAATTTTKNNHAESRCRRV